MADNVLSSTAAFKWEEAYTEGINIRTVLQEDEGGSVENAINRLIMEERRQRRRLHRPSKVRLGMMRYLYIGLDISAANLLGSFDESRLKIIQETLLNLIDKFFEFNPLSSIGIIFVRDKRAQRLCALTSTVKHLKDAISGLNESMCTGEFSLQSMLEMVVNSFQNVPIHTSKQCLFIISSLNTVDAVNLNQTYEQLKMRSINCSIISFGAEVFAYKKLCATTLGKYGVVLHKQHLNMLLDEHVQPPPLKREQGNSDSIVRMGFPRRKKAIYTSFCTCHELLNEKLSTNLADESRGSAYAFFCPQCDSKYCHTPVQCRFCGLLLLTSPQLARAHQHLEPLPAFKEGMSNDGFGNTCFACDDVIKITDRNYSCPNCQAVFCIECDILLHESLKVCPSCG